MIDQLTVCLPNEPGKLAQMSRAMGANNIQIHALMVADTTDFGIIRIVCDRPQDALSLLLGLPRSRRSLASRSQTSLAALGSSSTIWPRPTSTWSTLTPVPWAVEPSTL